MPRLLFDVTKHVRQRGTASGLNRVASALLSALQGMASIDLVPVIWRGSWGRGAWRAIELGGTAERSRDLGPTQPSDVFFTPEVFGPQERLGFVRWWHARPCRRFALFHDAIPRTHPAWVRRKSVRRFPAYLQMLAEADGVFAVSQASAQALREAWRTMGCVEAPLFPFAQGADGFGEARQAWGPTPSGPPWRVLQIGSMEPRKRPDLVLEAVNLLVAPDFPLELTFAGRVNAEHGQALATRVRDAQRAGKPVRFVEQPRDDALRELMHAAHLVVFASQAEGWGLPVTEALWLGRPVVAAPVPAAVETDPHPALHVVASTAPEVWAEAIRAMLGRPWTDLFAAPANLTTWRESAAHLCAQMALTGGPGRSGD